jgi:hypothetical protein
MSTTTSNPNRAAVRHALIKGTKAEAALPTLVNTCTSGSTCTQVQADPIAKQALATLQGYVTASQASQTSRDKLLTLLSTARKTANADFVNVRTSLAEYELAVNRVAAGNAAIITAAGCLSREEGGLPAQLEAVTTVTTKLGKLPTQGIITWPAAAGATSYAIEVNLTPQNPSGTWTALNSGTSRRRTVTGPSPNSQLLARVAAQDAHGNQAAWSAPVLVTTR